MIDKSSAVPLYVQIQNDITASIRSEQLKPNAQIPSESKLASSYGVSRMTVRKAIDYLVSKGIIFRKPGKGTFVSDGIVNYRLSTIMSFSSTLSSLGHSITTRVLNQEIIPATPEIISKLGLQQRSQVVFIRRLRIVEEKPAAIHISYLHYPEFAPILEVDLSINSLLRTVESIGALTLTYSRDTVQASVVTNEEARLLGVPDCSPVLIVEGVAFTMNGSPVRLTKAIYRGDLFRLSSINSIETGSSLETTITKDRRVQ